VFRIGIDVGGTHTDGVLIKDKSIFSKVKIPTIHEELSSSIGQTIESLLSDTDPSEISKMTISTTLATNVILERKLPNVGLILLGGPGISPEHFIKDNFSYIVNGAIDHRGRITKNLNLSEIDFISDNMLGQNIDTIALCGKFSVRNPIHEKTIKDRIGSKFSNVSMGHSLSGSLNFPRRVNTTYLNAGTFSINKKFIDNLLTFIKSKNFKAPITLLKADGGTISINEAYDKPIQTVLSGSAAGVIGVMSMKRFTEEASLLIDIGGTSSDFTIFYRGEPLFEPYGIKIGNYHTLVRAISSYSIGLGGDSFVRFEDGKLKIGPERLGNAIIFGGQDLTFTDVVYFYNKKLQKEAVKNNIEHKIDLIADKLHTNKEEASQIILKSFSDKISNFIISITDDINNRPVYTIKELISKKKFEISKIYLMGGPAEEFQSFLKNFISTDISLLPHYDVVNAIGAAVSKNTTELTLFADTSVKRLSVPEKEHTREIDQNFTLESCYKVLREMFGNTDFEISEEMVFNIISGFYRAGKTFRIKAQVKPGVELYLDM